MNTRNSSSKKTFSQTRGNLLLWCSKWFPGLLAQPNKTIVLFVVLTYLISTEYLVLDENLIIAFTCFFLFAVCGSMIKNSLMDVLRDSRADVLDTLDILFNDSEEALDLHWSRINDTTVILSEVSGFLMFLNKWKKDGLNTTLNNIVQQEHSDLVSARSEIRSIYKTHLKQILEKS